VTHPAVLVTLTAPSFGMVHAARSGAPCHIRVPRRHCPHGRPLACFERHDGADKLVGSPLCRDCYDYEGAVLHNAATPELWRRTTIYVVRHLAAVLGLTQAETRRRVRLSFCRVAEFQCRGVVHLHAVVRADGLDVGVPPVDAEQLAAACLHAARPLPVEVSGLLHDVQCVPGRTSSLAGGPDPRPCRTRRSCWRGSLAGSRDRLGEPRRGCLRRDPAAIAGRGDQGRRRGPVLDVITVGFLTARRRRRCARGARQQTGTAERVR